ncbi:M23 family metallopeptidase [Muribaculaceae bacterium Isolate-113 (HZI)]|jgi:murein DD-endopeptidase MepM/ murein hydrolase activator NlpD|uniref:M23 family metallopeptidase n=1 Tax=Bacteroidales TaxID=171549 RepID=UPI000E994B78|nr:MULTISPECIES: M23 family metallopeptidase [Bacteroidales]MBJ2191839.1 M23 family metallopeptidase [Muribaculaceae bacterium]ROS81347.1 M23 family metallopeptidase [Muribaculaceae bacterium Isolate-036 (Harlan)]ROT19352.1 M23 family metallopeptidase [Muribaculaceae bacterium Isolate-114 (HZI)]ROT21007.1 M23 family metallopeptidase [Muribaculaceae bacterium Isolate-113 (HZI)]RXE67651.1 M23 family metallopeptidase [Muribaculaceae bacterium Isolate-001 (NCI)]HBY17104.1 peptidase M23 [Porphyrom
MKRPIYYIYNPETDNFERVFPSIKGRIWGFLRIGCLSLLIGIGLYFVIFYSFEAPTEQNLRKENAILKSQYNILNRRLDNSLKVMANIQNRDDNFYRVMMQMDPVGYGQRLAGLDNEKRYRELQNTPDAGLVRLLTQRLDLFERQLYAQSLSFDQLKETASKQKDKLAHIPSVIPINIKDFTMSSGYGVRRDPIYGSSKFHTGLDFAAKTGTPVFATADGKVTEAGRQSGYGNCIDISHGYNYLTRYAHLSEILVKPGQEVKRGEMIGKVGSTGKSTGSHLHYEVRFKDEPQNPVNYYFMDLTPEEYAEMVQLAENAGHVMD